MALYVTGLPAPHNNGWTWTRYYEQPSRGLFQYVAYQLPYGSTWFPGIVTGAGKVNPYGEYEWTFKTLKDLIHHELDAEVLAISKEEYSRLRRLETEFWESYKIRRKSTSSYFGKRRVEQAHYDAICYAHEMVQARGH